MQVDVPLDYSLRQYVSVLYKVPRMQVSMHRAYACFPALQWTCVSEVCPLTALVYMNSGCTVHA